MTRNRTDESEAAAAALLQALRQAVGAPHVLTAPDELAPFLQDWRGRYRGEALAVVLPAATEEVSAVVLACAAAGVNVVPQGGNTGLVAGATPLAGTEPGDRLSVVVALRRMNRVRDIDPVGNTMVAEAGCVLETLQQTADEHGRLYAVTFGAEGSCQIGGNVATNAGGTGVLKYGSTREQVLGLEVVLADGRIWNGLRTLRKDNAGYALKHLFIGAEGTLGIVTAVALRLHPKPAVTAAAWFTVNSADDALRALGELQDSAGDRIAAYELLNRAQLQAVLRHFPQIRLPVDPDV
jgi:FAD/FMN-containing dehydrogenase